MIVCVYVCVCVHVCVCVCVLYPAGVHRVPLIRKEVVDIVRADKHPQNSLASSTCQVCTDRQYK